jgi:hypothetical protein
MSHLRRFTGQHRDRRPARYPAPAHPRLGPRPARPPHRPAPQATYRTSTLCLSTDIRIGHHPSWVDPRGVWSYQGKAHGRAPTLVTLTTKAEHFSKTPARAARMAGRAGRSRCWPSAPAWSQPSAPISRAGCGAAQTPLVEPAILTRRPYIAGLAVEVGFYAAMGGMVLSLNVMFQTGLGFSPLACGVATMATAVAAAPGAIVSSRVLPRLGRTTMHIGTAVMAIGLGATIAVLASGGPGLSAWYCAGPLALAGFGMGLVFVPMADVILAGVAPHETGSASGLLETVQQLATALGIALAGTVLFGQLGSARGHGAFVSAATVALTVSAGLLALAWLAVWWLPRRARAGG